MEVILLQDVDHLGAANELVNVKNGYARNFLIPQKKALRATEASKKLFEIRRAEIEAKNAEERSEAEKASKKYENLAITLVRQASEVAWPYIGYGVEFLYLPAMSFDAIVDLVSRGGLPPPAILPDTTHGIHSTVRRESWVYEILEPIRRDDTWHAEIRRAPREAWRPGEAGPFYVVEGASPEKALREAREFLVRLG